MKKSSIKVFFVVLLALFCVSQSAFATQGVYGTVYADTDIDGYGVPLPDAQSRTVANALIYIYNNNDDWVGQVTASACGYYSVQMYSTGWFKFVVVDDVYYLRVNNACSTVDRTDYVGGYRALTVSSGWWHQLNIATF